MKIAGANEALKKKKKVSKKKKSSWRKHSCVGEVDEYLEDKRQKERIGEITKDNVALLFDEDKKQSGRKLRDRRVDLLDAHKSPLSNSGSQKQNKIIVDPSRVVNLSRKDLKKSRFKGAMGDNGGKEEEEEEDSEMKKRFKNPYDVWTSKETKVVDDLELYRRRICRVEPVKRPTRATAPTVAAIVTPHPGQSYNPSFQHHQSLLKEAVDREIVKRKREKKIINATDAMFPSRKDAPTQESWLQEMSAGLGGMVKIIEENKELKGAEKKMVMKKRRKDDDDNDAGGDGVSDGNDDDDDEKAEEMDVSKKGIEDKKEDNSDDDDAGAADDDEKMQLSYNAPVRREDKKSEKTRRKMGERVKEEERRLREKMSREKLSQAFRVKSLRRQLQQQELQRAARVQHRRLLKEKQATAPKKLGKSRFEEPAPVLKLTEEIRGDLRRLRPESHPMRELVNSMQRRNITPTTPRGSAIKPRKYKPKMFEKKSHKAIKADE